MAQDDRLFRMRKEYSEGSLVEEETHADPLEQFRGWFDLALSSAGGEPNACALATCGKESLPSVRIVLLKGFDSRGFTFFSNYESRKGRQIAENPAGALVFFWESLERQIRIEGSLEKVSSEESDAYFASRPRNAQIGAAISRQSAVLSSRSELEDTFEKTAATFADRPIPRPSHWGGFRLIPVRFEFWQGRESRLHDRICYVKAPSGEWIRERLWP